MGTWGTEAFESDRACDWTYGPEEVDDPSLVDRTLDGVLVRGEEYVDADAGVEALAACEVLARPQDKWGRRDAYTETVDTWVTNHPIAPGVERLAKALRAIDRVCGDGSELRELWEDSDGAADWSSSVADLRRRVAPSTGSSE